MKTIFALLFVFVASSFAEWPIVSFIPEGDSLFRVKYRMEYMTDTGIVRRTKVEKWKCKNLRCTDTTYKRIRIIPASEVEE